MYHPLSSPRPGGFVPFRTIVGRECWRRADIIPVWRRRRGRRHDLEISVSMREVGRRSVTCVRSLRPVARIGCVPPFERDDVVQSGDFVSSLPRNEIVHHASLRPRFGNFTVDVPECLRRRFESRRGVQNYVVPEPLELFGRVQRVFPPSVMFARSGTVPSNVSATRRSSSSERGASKTARRHPHQRTRVIARGRPRSRSPLARRFGR